MKLKNRLFKITLAVVLAVLLAAAGWGWSVWVRIHEALPAEPQTNREPSEKPETDIVNILLLGTDQVGQEAARADTIMVVSLNEATGEAALISIPRDARVAMPGRGGRDKLNHAMAFGGIALMIDTVESLLGVTVNYYVYTNFRGFAGVVDALGGVTIDVEKEMVHLSANDPFPFQLKPGRQSLNGEQALGYVRYRGDSQGDFGRMQRQQAFLAALFQEMRQLRTIFMLPRLLEQAARYLRTDMTVSELLAFGRRAYGTELDQVRMIVLKGHPQSVNGVSYIALDADFLRDTARDYLLWEKRP